MQIHKIIILLFFAFLAKTTIAQNDCSKDLKEAVNLYEQGMYKQVVEILTINLKKCRYEAQEKQTALKTLISCLEELDELEEAQKYTNEFLKLYPIYKSYTTDPIPFVKELDRYKVTPRFSIGLNIGINYYKPTIKQGNSIWEKADYTQPYELRSGHFYSLSFQYFFNYNWSLGLSIDYQSHNFRRTITSDSTFAMNYSESYSDVRIPIVLTYHYKPWRKIYPSVFAGIYASKIIIAQADGTINVTIPDATTGKNSIYSDEQKAVNLIDYRNKHNGGVIAGIGINYKVNRLISSFNVAYSHDLNTYTRNNTYFSTGTLAKDFYYISDEMKLNSFQFTFNFAWTLTYRIKTKY